MKNLKNNQLSDQANLVLKCETAAQFARFHADEFLAWKLIGLTNKRITKLLLKLGIKVKPNRVSHLMPIVKEYSNIDKARIIAETYISQYKVLISETIVDEMKNLDDHEKSKIKIN